MLYKIIGYHNLKMLSFCNEKIFAVFLLGGGQCDIKKLNLKNKRIEDPHWLQEITEYTCIPFEGIVSNFIFSQKYFEVLM